MLKSSRWDWLKEDAHELMAKYPDLLYSIDLLQNVGSNLKDQEGDYEEDITEEDIEMVKSYLKDNSKKVLNAEEEMKRRRVLIMCN